MRTPVLATVLTLGLCGAALAQASIIVVQETTAPSGVEGQQVAPTEPLPMTPRPAPPEPAPPAAVPQVAAPQVAAPTPPAPASSARFRFERANEGYLRFDNENGQIAYCAARTVGWACEVVPEDRAALDSDCGSVARMRPAHFPKA